MSFDGYEHLLFDHVDDGVLLIRINRPDQSNAFNPALHEDFVRVWHDIDDDPGTRVAVITGQGQTFSAGGDIAYFRAHAGQFDFVHEMARGAWKLGQRMIDCEKPIISAINGPAIGAGLAVALLADISIIGQNTRLSDGHVRVGVAAGDHAAAIWPLLCGMAKSKYYLLTADFLDGTEAERIGLVSACVPDDQVLDKALHIAHKLSSGPQLAIRSTKRTLNHWLRTALPAFDASIGAEMLSFFGDDVAEGLCAVAEGRRAKFPSAMNHSE